MIGATITVVGMPASANWRTASRRFIGVGARGSMVRAILPSSVVIEMAARASPRSAMRARMSMSRVISDDLVTMPTGCEVLSSTSRIERMMRRSRSMG